MVLQSLATKLSAEPYCGGDNERSNVRLLNSFDYACQCRRVVRAVYYKRVTHNLGHLLVIRERECRETMEQIALKTRVRAVVVGDCKWSCDQHSAT